MSLLPDPLRAFLALAPHATIAASLCDSCVEKRWTGARDLAGICLSAGLPLSRQGAVEKVLHAGSGVGIFRQVSALTWEISDAHRDVIDVIAPMLRGAALYDEKVHRDENDVRVVLTRPPKPSRLEGALEASGYSYLGLDNTSEAFADMAARATTRLMVMTPFLDEHGAAVALSLFERAAHTVRRELILRSKDGGIPPEGYSHIRERLKRLDVAVYDYRLDRENGAGYETFHGKVILVDDQWCYVGSANMTQWSFNYSMELGVTVRGSAATRIGQIADAIISIAKRV